jgi:glucosamine-6-phosphate deaminase
MKVVIVENYKELSKVMFSEIKKSFMDIKEIVMNTTTGATFDGTFELLVDAVNNGEMDIENSVIMNLDEFVGPKDASYAVYSYMHSKFYDRIKFKPRVIELLDGSLDDLQKEIRRYKRILEKYPRDLQLLGLGVNGHLGANEPHTPFNKRIFLADSAESTIESTMAYSSLTRENTPTQMITLGLADIFDAKKIILGAYGMKKAMAVKAALKGPISEDCPASLLQKHSNTVVVLDKDAASLL